MCVRVYVSVNKVGTRDSISLNQYSIVIHIDIDIGIHIDMSLSALLAKLHSVYAGSVHSLCFFRFLFKPFKALVCRECVYMRCDMYACMHIYIYILCYICTHI